MSAGIAVIAKAPAPGRTKTRLCPPCTPHQAAALAQAALADTLDVVAAIPVARRVLVLDGVAGGWLPPGFAVVAQRGEGLAERLANAFTDAGGPLLLVGMDTPQVTATLLRSGLAALADGAGAVLGPAVDGGYWAIGLQRPEPAVFDGIPMSTPATCAAQRARLAALGLRTVGLPALRDVDEFADAVAVAAAAPGTRFAQALARLETERAA